MTKFPNYQINYVPVHDTETGEAHSLLAASEGKYFECSHQLIDGYLRGLIPHWVTFEKDGIIQAWDVADLWQYAQGVQIIDMPLGDLVSKQFNSSISWNMIDILDFASHMARANKCDCNYPIILDKEGRILDGKHRLVKAIALGKSTLPTQTLDAMPEPLISIENKTINLGSKMIELLNA